MIRMAARQRQGIRAENLAAEIRRQLEEYTDEVKSVVFETARDVAETAAEMLKEESPKRSGEYKKHWTVSSDRKGVVVCQSAGHHRLTHLLEKGHALRRGGRVVGESPAYPHIAKVERECVDKYVIEIERRLGR